MVIFRKFEKTNDRAHVASIFLQWTRYVGEGNTYTGRLSRKFTFWLSMPICPNLRVLISCNCLPSPLLHGYPAANSTLRPGLGKSLIYIACFAEAELGLADMFVSGAEGRASEGFDEDHGMAETAAVTCSLETRPWAFIIMPFVAVCILKSACLMVCGCLPLMELSDQ